VCIALATFQAIAVPPAGILVVALLMLGIAVYLTVLAPGAALADATAQARDPELARQRGRSPLVLVPIANPASAASLVGVAATVRTPGTGRVMLLSIVPAIQGSPDEEEPALRDAETILGESLRRGFEREVPAETLFTVASDPLLEIARVVRLHRCETVVLGAPKAEVEGAQARLEALITQLDVDVAMLRAPRRWRVAGVRRVLVPLGGLGHHSRLRARLLASLDRNDDCEITFLRSVPPDATPAERRRAEREVRARASDEAEGHFQVLIETEADPVDAIVRHAGETDLIVMGFQHGQDMRSLFGPFIRQVIDRCDAPLILLGSRRPRSLGGLR
jgi:hypothetical protein